MGRSGQKAPSAPTAGRVDGHRVAYSPGGRRPGMALLDSLLVLAVDAALGAWLGAMAFFSFVAAPRIFGVLDEGEAGRVVNAIFPRYYEVGVALGTFAGLAGVALGVGPGFDVGALAVVVLAALAVATAAYARWVLIPRMEAARDDAFQRYHRQSVLLNGVAMVAVAAALVASHV